MRAPSYRQHVPLARPGRTGCDGGQEPRAQRVRHQRLLHRGQAQEAAKTTDPSTWSGLDLVYKKEHVFDKKPIAYPHVREADIMWSKVVWRIVDLREKINQPLYFPTQPIGGRMSLTDLLLVGVTWENPSRSISLPPLPSPPCFTRLSRLCSGLWSEIKFPISFCGLTLPKEFRSMSFITRLGKMRSILTPSRTRQPRRVAQALDGEGVVLVVRGEMHWPAHHPPADTLPCKEMHC